MQFTSTYVISLKTFHHGDLFEASADYLVYWCYSIFDLRLSIYQLQNPESVERKNCSPNHDTPFTDLFIPVLPPHDCNFLWCCSHIQGHIIAFLNYSTHYKRDLLIISI